MFLHLEKIPRLFQFCPECIIAFGVAQFFYKKVKEKVRIHTAAILRYTVTTPNIELLSALVKYFAVCHLVKVSWLGSREFYNNSFQSIN